MNSLIEFTTVSLGDLPQIERTALVLIEHEAPAPGLVGTMCLAGIPHDILVKRTSKILKEVDVGTNKQSRHSRQLDAPHNSGMTK